MTGRFADLRQTVETIEERAEVAQPQPQPELPSRKPAEAEPMRTIQARVPQSVRTNFAKLLIDLQDEFPKKEVSQEEGITALLCLITEQPRLRSQWVKLIKERRAQTGPR